MDNEIKKPHHCPNCQKTFASLHLLTQHSRVHSGEKPYACNYCERKFKQLSHLQQHTRLHTGERPYKCSVTSCGRSFIQLSNLQQHMKVHASESAKNQENLVFCIHCGKGYKGQVSLAIHQSKKHAQYATRTTRTDNRHITYVCSHCNKQYLDENSLKQHLTEHQNNNCHQNGSTTSSSSDSVVVTATATALWPCSICAIVFANEIGLLSHLEQMKADPKHNKELQNLFQTIKTDPNDTFQTSAINLNEILVNTLISNGNETGGITTVNDVQQQQIGVAVSAELLAQNLMQLNHQN